MVRQDKTIIKLALKLALQATLVVLAVFVVVIDTGLLEQGNSEFSITELSQEACILVSAILFGLSARYDRQARGFFVLVTGLFATMLIRESDAFFDQIQHGFWVIPALIMSLSAVLYASKFPGTIIKPMLENMDSKNFVYINLGLIIILIFSRTFGSGIIWREIMGADYSIVYKTVIQEGIELLGYILVLYGSILVWLEAFKKTHKVP
jgi:hypothetical protein